MSTKPLFEARAAQFRAALEEATRSEDPIDAAAARLRLATGDAMQAWYVNEFAHQTRRSAVATAFHSVLGGYVANAALTLTASGVDPRITAETLARNIAITALVALDNIQAGEIEVMSTKVGPDGIERDVTLDDFRRRS